MEPGSDAGEPSNNLDDYLEAALDSLKLVSEPLATSSTTPTAQPTKMPSVNRDADLEAAIESLNLF
jgi:hypothetical protein